MTAKDIHDALDYLHKSGMTDPQLNRIHHKKSKESFSAALEYWREQAEKGADLRQPSVEYGRRLAYVMQRHMQLGGRFPQLIEEAWQKWPTPG